MRYGYAKSQGLNLPELCSRARKHATDAELIFNAMPATISLGECAGEEEGRKEGQTQTKTDTHTHTHTHTHTQKDKIHCDRRKMSLNRKVEQNIRSRTENHFRRIIAFGTISSGSHFLYFTSSLLFLFLL